jgi:uncharacterized protein (DUF302 family)
MQVIKSVFALIGLIAIVAVAVLAIKAYSIFKSFDPGARETYANMAKVLIETGNPAEATVWKAQVKDGLTFDDVDQAIRSVATSMNIKDVGALPLGDQVSAMQGKSWRKLKIYLYCNPLTAAHMIDYSDAFSAFLPCRVALLEDKTGKLWIYTMNMDMLINGGKPLPSELKEEALRVKKIMQTVLADGAKGEF